MRRVAIVVGQLGMGGSEKQVCHLASRLPEWGYEPLVIALSGGAREADLRDRGVQTVVLTRRHTADVGRLLRVASALRRYQPAIVHGFDYAGSVYGKLAAWLAGVGPVVGGLRCIYVPPARVVWMERALRQSTAAVISNSHAAKHVWAYTVGYPKERIVVVPNGISFKEMSGRPTDGRSLRSLLGVPADTPLVGCVSSIYDLKNPLMLVRVSAQLNRSHPRTHFVWIGDGPMQTVLETAVNEAGLGNVFHLTGRRPDAAWLARDLTIGVLPSISEGLPNAIMEYMYWRLPIVVTDAGGCRELVQHGRTGYVVPIDDVEGMTSAVAEMLSQPGLALEMGRRARERLEQNFSIERMVGSTAATYDAVIDQRDLSGLELPSNAPARPVEAAS
jgi:glycosyltransferase involved in cell wall biosynthesis